MNEAFFWLVTLGLLLVPAAVWAIYSKAKSNETSLQAVTDRDPLLKEVAPGLSVVVEQEPELKDVTK